MFNKHEPGRSGTWMDRLQLLIVAAVTLGALKAVASQSLLVGVGLLLPLMRYSSSPTYRRRVEERLGLARRRLAEFAKAGGPVPLGAIGFLVVLPVLVFALVNGRKLSSADNLPLNLTTASLILEGDVELSEYTVPTEREREFFPGELPYSLCETESGLRSAYPIGNLVFTVPVYAASWIVGGEIGDRKPQWRLAKLTAALLTALSAGTLLAILLPLAGARGALSLAWMYGIGSAAFSTLSQGMWSQTGVVSLLLLALWIEFEREDERSWVASRPRTWEATQGVLLGLALTMRLTAGMLLLPFGLWQLVRSPLRAMRVALAAGLACLPFALYYHSAYGSWLGPQFLMGESRFDLSGIPQAMTGLLASPGRGLFVYQPWLLLLVFWPFLAPVEDAEGTGRRVPRGWACFAIGGIVLHTVLMAAWDMWWGGHSWGSRMLVETLPLWALLLAPTVKRLASARQGRRLLLAGLVLGIMMQAGAVFGRSDHWNSDPVGALTPLEERVRDWSAPPFLYPLVKPSAP